MIVVLLGSPGSGKGTQAKQLQTMFGWIHLSTGDLLREEIRDGTELGGHVASMMSSGQLVPDPVILKLVENRFARDKGKTFILDGFPRTLEQARALFRQFPQEIFRVVFFQVPDAIVVKRLSGRRTCRSCGAAFHVEFNPSTHGDTCDRCGTGVLVQRPDDTVEVVQNRIAVYRSQTEPMIDFFRNQKAPSGFFQVDGAGPLEHVFAEIVPFLVPN